jgi:phosphoserine aminotransferase
MNRVHNFSAGPAILPLEVLQQAQADLVDYQGTGASIMEKSHRGADYTQVHEEATALLTSVLGLGNDFEVLFLQGGASTQFLMAPMNLLSKGQTADYINTGAWSTKAIKEAKAFGEVHEVYSGKDGNFTHIPTQEELALSEHARYVHFTSNNTIFGTQFATEPETNGVPLVCDASSDFLSKPIDIARYGIIYAGAQKNLGPAGVTIVIARKDVLEGISKTDIPTIMDYRTHVQNLFNTPPVFPVYMVKLVLEWIQSKGGISYFERFNLEKAGLLYSAIDEDDFYSGTADLASRSLMNVTFRLPSEELEKKFIQEATAAHLDALKGHRSVGGVRASIYNACPMESVQALVAFMADFKAKHG